MPKPVARSADLNLLGACVLGDDTAVAEALHAPIDWGRFARLAAYNDVQGMAGQRLQSAGAAVPAAVSEQLRDAVRQDAVMHLSQTATSVRLVALLGEAGVPALVLKGAALAQQLYRDHPEWRRSSDIDILIEQAISTWRTAHCWPMVSTVAGPRTNRRFAGATCSCSSPMCSTMFTLTRAS